MTARRKPETEEQFTWRIQKVYGRLAPSVITGLHGYYLDELKRAERQKKIIDNWDDMRAWVRRNVPQPQTIMEILKNYGAPVLPEELDMTPLMVYNAMQNGKEMRIRYTIMRLAEDIGVQLGACASNPIFSFPSTS